MALDILGMTSSLLWLYVVVTIWELIWKGLALWKAGKLNHKVWFVFILVLNTVGILPIIYLIIYRKKKK